MKWHFSIIFISIFLWSVHYAQAKGVHTLMLSDSDVAQVHTAIGYSTMLQFDVRPSQVILGDQDAFKAEYVGSSIAIKPTVSGVSTNLFVLTEYDKFNFRLTAGRGFEPDYIIRVKRKPKEPAGGSSPVITKHLNLANTIDGITLRLISLSLAKTSGIVIYSFELESKNKRLAFEPGDFDVTQRGKSLPIENIYLERLAFDKGQRLQGMILIRADKITSKRPMLLAFSPRALKRGLHITAPPI